jgi:hypothetical protein
MASLRSYEEVNGPVPEGPVFDSNGLACQVRGGSSNTDETNLIDPNPIPVIQSMIDLNDIMFTSNVIPTEDNKAFREQADEAARARREQGYKADGSLSGPFSEDNPPPGKKFNGYGKGCTHINWEENNPSVSLLNRLFNDILPSGDTDSLRKLLSNNSVDVNLRIGKGPTSEHTMLHWCASRNQFTMVELLLEFHADTTMVDMEGRTAKDLAMKGTSTYFKLSQKHN